jgi:hypothetical protein
MIIYYVQAEFAFVKIEKNPYNILMHYKFSSRFNSRSIVTGVRLPYQSTAKLPIFHVPLPKSSIFDVTQLTSNSKRERPTSTVAHSPSTIRKGYNIIRIRDAVTK